MRFDVWRDFDDSPRARMVVVARVLAGTLYVAGGNELDDGGLDCSGYFQYAAALANVEPFASDFPARLDLRAIELYERLPSVPVAPGGKPVVLPGDPVFYGAGGIVSHVAIVTAIDAAGDVVEVFGASGGGMDVTSPGIALRRGARVKRFTSALYRKDLVGFRRLPLDGVIAPRRIR